MKVAHFARFDPNRSGQYATVKDLIMAERLLGVDARLIDASGCNACKHWFSIPGQKDGNLETVPVDWAHEADVLVRHTAIPSELEQKGTPIVLCAHGRPEHTFLLETSGKSPIFTFYKTLISQPQHKNYRAIVTFWKEYLFHLSFLLPERMLHYVPAMVDLDTYNQSGPCLDYGNKSGKPNLMIADMWRTDESPFNVLYAAAKFKELYCPEAKVHVFGMPTDTTNNAVGIIAQRLEEIGVWGQAFGAYNKMPDAYRAADILITPHHIATRVIREASACGLPIVANQGCKYTDYTANPKDVEGFAKEINRCWNEVSHVSNIQKIPARYRSTAEKEFNLEQSGKAMIEVLEKALTVDSKTTVLVPDGKFLKKEYKSYQTYVNNQFSKLPGHIKTITQHDEAYHQTLTKRISESDVVKPKMNVLCLGARLGGEVQAFLDKGCFAIGIDLNPGQSNKYVVTGDFHRLQYADDSVDVVFTNSLDHVFDIERLLDEVNRVLKFGGFFIVETALEGRVDNWTSLRWESSTYLIEFLESHGLKIINHNTFKSMWFNEQFCLQKVVETKKVISMSLLGDYGRFGNQIFQYASLALYARKHKLQMQIPEKWIGRQLFDCDDVPDVRKKLLLRNFRKEKVAVFEDGFKEDLANKDICGYFQCHTKHFAPHKEYIRKLFKPNKVMQQKLDIVMQNPNMTNTTLIGIHLRRGDFDHGKFQPAPTQWYLDWLEKNQAAIGKFTLFIASDEPDKVIKDFEKYPCVVLRTDNDTLDFYIDFYVLSQCDWLLISNSAFSFTAAMLNEKSATCYRPDYDKKKLVGFDPWDSQSFSGIPPKEDIKVINKPTEKDNGDIKLALVYNPEDNKLQPGHYSQTYKQMFDALVSKFPNAQHITESCSAKDIEADKILIYDIHSSHHITIDGLKNHRATKYTYFDDPHQEAVKGHYPGGQYVHKLGAEERLARAFDRGVEHIICPYIDSYYKYLAPFFNGDAEKMLLWFPVAPVNEFAQAKFRHTRLAYRKTEILANGATAAGECSIYDFRKWAFQQNGVTRKRASIGKTYQQFLSEWAGVLALAEYAAVPKYLEVPLAGCVCFAQRNADYDKMGFEDGVSCMFVTKENFGDKMRAFSKHSHNHIYQEIADAGYKLVSEKYTAEHFADFIHKHMKDGVTHGSTGK